MPQTEGNPDGKVLLTPEKKPDESIESDVITTQPEKNQEDLDVTQPAQKSEETFDCLTGLTLCCNAMQECWLCVFACSYCGDGSCCVDCATGICEGFAECLEGCGDCCIHCCQ